ncbi:hypothetical protein, partial [Niveispirillum sp. KHB5.9]|uniref:hypothetical protein n=1 Tax=Niveispirillum sp. KHB5.9 TaxID=3400269 RepID=UPI003A8520EB
SKAGGGFLIQSREQPLPVAARGNAVMNRFVESLMSALLTAKTGDAGTKNSRTGGHLHASASSPPQADVNPELEPALRRLFADRDPMQAGSVHLLELDSLRDRLGPRWTSIAERVHQLTVKLLKQQLQPSDTWFRQGDSTYVVVFTKLGREQARLVCAKVVEEMQCLLLGSADTGSITIHSAIRAAGADISFVPARLKDMLDDAAGRIGHQPLPVASAAASGEPAGPIEVRYLPFWDVQQQVLSVYTARSCRQRPGRSLLWGYDCLEDPTDPQQILGMDIQITRDALEVAAELYENRFRFFLSVPVNFESLAVSNRWREMVAVLQTIPAHMLPFMTYHLVGAPAGVPAGRLSEMVGAMRPFGRTVMVVVEPGTTDLAAIAASGAKVASIQLPAGASAERLRGDLLRFGAAAAKHRLRTSVEGVNDAAMEALCDEAEISFLSGNLASDWMEVPEHIVRMSRTDFLRQKRDHGATTPSAFPNRNRAREPIAA